MKNNEKEKSIYEIMLNILSQDDVTGITVLLPKQPAMQFMKADDQDCKKESKP